MTASIQHRADCRSSARWLSPGHRLAALAAALMGLWAAGCAPSAGIPGPEGPLRAPELGRVTGLDGQIEITLKARSKADSYTVYWGTTAGLKRGQGTKVEGVGPVFKLGGLSNGTVYHFAITAVRDGQESPDALAASGMPVKEHLRDYPNYLAVITQPGDSFATLGELFLKDRTKGALIQEFNRLEALTPFTAVAIPKRGYRPGGLTPGAYQMVPVLTYHQFSPNKANKMTVPLAQFEKEMQFLKDNGYHVVPLSQFVEFMNLRAQLPEKSVVITIDDGWMSFYEYAYPVLKKFGYPATLFVYTDFPESDSLALTWPQVKEMSQGGIDIQCHTKSHRNLRMQKGEAMPAYLEALEQEFSVCKKILKEKIGVEPKYLAYPYGATNHLVVAMARKAGFEVAFTVERGSNPFFYPDMRVRRSMIYGGYTLKEFENNLRSYDDRLMK